MAVKLLGIVESAESYSLLRGKQPKAHQSGTKEKCDVCNEVELENKHK